MNETEAFEDNLMAELTALNMAVHRVLHHLADLSGEPRKFLQAELEVGLEAISKTNLLSVPVDRRETVLENARARYQDIVGSVKP